MPVNLFYKSAGLSNVKVSILNANGKEVFTEVIKKTDGFTRPYNLYKHPLGIYTIVVKNNEGSLTESFIRSEETELKAAHVVKLANNKYLLTVRSDMALGKVNVKIFDGSKLVHEQANEISSDFGQIFTLKNIDQLVTFEVTNSNGKKIN